MKKYPRKNKKKRNLKKNKNILNSGKNLAKILNQVSLKIAAIDKNQLKLVDGTQVKILQN